MRRSMTLALVLVFGSVDRATACSDTSLLDGGMALPGSDPFDAGPGCHVELRFPDSGCAGAGTYVAVCDTIDAGDALTPPPRSGCSVAIGARGHGWALALATLAIVLRRRR